MGKISKCGEYVSAFPKKKKKKRKPPLNSEKKKSIINRVETTIKKHKQLFELGDNIEWTKEEIEWQKLSLLPNDPKESSKESSTKNKIKSNIFCDHKKGIIKDGYIICSKCNSKWKMKHKIGTYK